MNEQSDLGKTKAQCLRAICREYAFAEKDCDKITSATIVEFAPEVSSRPTVDELDRLLEHFQLSAMRDPRIIPIHIFTLFAIFFAGRQDEITRLRWENQDVSRKRILVRKMKNPGMTGGVETWCELPDPCSSLIDMMPRTKECIFRFNTDVVSRRCTDACKLLEIKDLRFHDLRHEAASRLAAMGRTIPQLAVSPGTNPGKACNAIHM
ncbi:MAG: tyrosine-type recombinase/integrase [Paracoccaceae bacterium]